MYREGRGCEAQLSTRTSRHARAQTHTHTHTEIALKIPASRFFTDSCGTHSCGPDSVEDHASPQPVCEFCSRSLLDQGSRLKLSPSICDQCVHSGVWPAVICATTPTSQDIQEVRASKRPFRTTFHRKTLPH